MEKTIQYVVSEEAYKACKNGQVGSLLRKELRLSKKEISRLKWQGEISCKGHLLHVNEHVNVGDELVLSFFEKESDETGSCGDVSILYEDEDVVVVFKPAHMAVHPVHGHMDCLGTRLKSHYAKLGKTFTIRPIGRLDYDVSGCMLYAKNQVSAARLNAQQESGVFTKTYIALASGKVDCMHGCIDLPIQKVDSLRRVIGFGKWARTHFDVVGYNETVDCSVLKVRIDTGRTHQIRVHMKAMGHALLGDCLYGDGRVLEQVGLHCWKMSFVSPFTKEEVVVEAPVEEVFGDIWKKDFK